MTVSPSDTNRELPFTVSVNLRRTYKKIKTYWNFLNGSEWSLTTKVFGFLKSLGMPMGGVSKTERGKLQEYGDEEYCRLLAKQEIDLRKHNAKRAAMTQFDLRYSAYVILCHYLSSTGQKELSADKLDSLTKKGKMSLIEFGKTYKAFNPKTSNYGETILKAVAKKLGASTPENSAAAFKWAYTTYDAMKHDRKTKKTLHCLKGYDGRCKKCVITLGCDSVQGSTLKTNKDLEIGCDECRATPGRNKDYLHFGMKEEEKVQEAAPANEKVSRRRLGDSAAYLLDRHHQIHGVHTPAILATLLEKIEEAQRNWRPRRR